MINFDIKPVSYDLAPLLQDKIDNLAKPVGALGKIEKLAVKIGCIQNSLTPKLQNPSILLFAGDHGIVGEGITAFPQECTVQMVQNFLSGGTGINVFTDQHNIALKIIDAGVKYDLDSHPKLRIEKIARGTKNVRYEPAMTMDECLECISRGAKIAQDNFNKGCNIVGFGEMGVGNSSASALIFSALCNVSIEECTGRGAGINDEQLSRKKKVLEESLKNNPVNKDPLAILSTFGGLEHAMMTGAMLKSAELGMILLIDGFISTAALMVATEIYPNILDYCIFSHKSNEKGHSLMIEILNAEPLLHLDMRLGEGSGTAIVYPLIESAVIMLNKMKSFDEAQVSFKKMYSISKGVV